MSSARLLVRHFNDKTSLKIDVQQDNIILSKTEIYCKLQKILQGSANGHNMENPKQHDIRPQLFYIKVLFVRQCIVFFSFLIFLCNLRQS